MTLGNLSRLGFVFTTLSLTAFGTACGTPKCPSNTVQVGMICKHITDAGMKASSAVALDGGHDAEASPEAASGAKHHLTPVTGGTAGMASGMDSNGAGMQATPSGTGGTPPAPISSSGRCSGGAAARTETCDNTDEDCDGQIDEALEMECGLSSLTPCRKGKKLCRAGVWGACTGAIDPRDEVCDPERVDENCDGVANENCSCTAGEHQECGVMRGVCKKGTQTCTKEGKWSTDCVGSIGPETEVCDGNLDQDCDGLSDSEDSDCECVNGVGMKCTAGLGICAEGTRMCVNGKWGQCGAKQSPQKEKCDGQPVDEDCDGNDNNGCDCQGNMERECASGTDTGECSKGTQHCIEGRWSECQGARTPSEELCDGKDSNCNERDDVTDRGRCPSGEQCAGAGTSAHCESIEPCGNGKLDTGEACDPTVTGPSNDTWRCSPDCAPRTVYTPCGGVSFPCDAASECSVLANSGSLCWPKSGIPFDANPNTIVDTKKVCPTVIERDGHMYRQGLLGTVACVITCGAPTSNSNDCPAQAKACVSNPYAAGMSPPPNEARYFCSP